MHFTSPSIFCYCSMLTGESLLISLVGLYTARSSLKKVTKSFDLSTFRRILPWVSRTGSIRYQSQVSRMMARVNFDNSFFERERQDATKESEYRAQIFIPDDEDHKVVFDLLSNYLQPDSPMRLPEILERILPLYCVAGPDKADPLKDMILELARQIPYYSPAQSKLVEFVQACGAKIESESSLQARSRMGFSESLGIYMNDFFTNPDEMVEDNEAENPVIYANTTAFSALCQRAGVLSPIESQISYAIDDALTGSHDQRTKEVRSAWILGAAQWIIYCAEQCFQFAIEVGVPGRHPSNILPKLEEKSFWRKLTGDRAGKTGVPVKTEKKTITMEKWRAWKDAFATFAHDKSLSLQCRVAAKEAADLMAGQEKLHSNS